MNACPICDCTQFTPDGAYQKCVCCGITIGEVIVSPPPDACPHCEGRGWVKHDRRGLSYEQQCMFCAGTARTSTEAA